MPYNTVLSCFFSYSTYYTCTPYCVNAIFSAFKWSFDVVFNHQMTNNQDESIFERETNVNPVIRRLQRELEQARSICCFALWTVKTCIQPRKGLHLLLNLLFSFLLAYSLAWLGFIVFSARNFIWIGTHMFCRV